MKLNEILYDIRLDSYEGVISWHIDSRSFEKYSESTLCKNCNLRRDQHENYFTKSTYHTSHLCPIISDPNERTLFDLDNFCFSPKVKNK